MHENAILKNEIETMVGSLFLFLFIEYQYYLRSALMMIRLQSPHFHHLLEWDQIVFQRERMRRTQRKNGGGGILDDDETKGEMRELEYIDEQMEVNLSSFLWFTNNSWEVILELS